MHRGLDFARTLDLGDPGARYLPASARFGQEYVLSEIYLAEACGGSRLGADQRSGHSSEELNRSCRDRATEQHQ